MEAERERGITIKARLQGWFTGQTTAGIYSEPIALRSNVDFNYEVSRSIAACEGAILVVDASLGNDAQTLANVYLALEHNLEIIPVINKIDLRRVPDPTR